VRSGDRSSGTKRTVSRPTLTRSPRSGTRKGVRRRFAVRGGAAAFRAGGAGKFLSSGRMKPRGIDDAALNKYAEMGQWYSLNRNALNPATGKADFASLLNSYHFEGTLFTATIANIPQLAPPENDEKTSIGFSIFRPTPMECCAARCWCCPLAAPVIRTTLILRLTGSADPTALPRLKDRGKSP